LLSDNSRGRDDCRDKRGCVVSAKPLAVHKMYRRPVCRWASSKPFRFARNAMRVQRAPWPAMISSTQDPWCGTRTPPAVIDGDGTMPLATKTEFERPVAQCSARYLVRSKPLARRRPVVDRFYTLCRADSTGDLRRKCDIALIRNAKTAGRSRDRHYELRSVSREKSKHGLSCHEKTMRRPPRSLILTRRPNHRRLPSHGRIRKPHMTATEEWWIE
jgi:hypothetical protein